jgi:ADP-ribosylglycohydrolase
MIDQPAASRARHCIVAGALGDALSGTFQGVTGAQPLLFPADPGLSEGTWLTLATCEAVARDGGRVHPLRVASVYLEWLDQKRFRDTRSATVHALRSLSAGASQATWETRDGSAPADDVARWCAPLAFVLDPGAVDDRRAIRDIALMTQLGEEAFLGALAIVAAIRRCLQGSEVPRALLAAAAEYLPDTDLRNRLIELDRFGGDAVEAVARFGMSGDAVAVVPLGLLIATRHSGDLRTAFGVAARAAGHARSIAAIAGGMLGVAGCDIPADLQAAVPERDEIEAVLQPFVQLVSGSVAQ